MNNTEILDVAVPTTNGHENYQHGEIPTAIPQGRFIKADKWEEIFGRQEKLRATLAEVSAALAKSEQDHSECFAAYDGLRTAHDLLVQKNASTNAAASQLSTACNELEGLVGKILERDLAGAAAGEAAEPEPSAVIVVPEEASPPVLGSEVGAPTQASVLAFQENLDRQLEPSTPVPKKSLQPPPTLNSSDLGGSFLSRIRDYFLK
jgi:hypothetical protein